ncbi:hypothetical protein FB451DRAFT_1227692 [Mycena latifolia]|nr:hypothetical protein FB451DRAFT_1227692 [Mycena latifolia]
MDLSPSVFNAPNLRRPAMMLSSATTGQLTSATVSFILVSGSAQLSILGRSFLPTWLHPPSPCPAPPPPRCFQPHPHSIIAPCRALHPQLQLPISLSLPLALDPAITTSRHPHLNTTQCRALRCLDRQSIKRRHPQAPLHLAIVAARLPYTNRTPLLLKIMIKLKLKLNITLLMLHPIIISAQLWLPQHPIIVTLLPLALVLLDFLSLLSPHLFNPPPQLLLFPLLLFLLLLVPAISSPSKLPRMNYWLRLCSHRVRN